MRRKLAPRCGAAAPTIRDPSVDPGNIPGRMTEAILLTLTCPECGHRWTVDVNEQWGTQLERDAVCPECCTELELDPEF